MSELGDQIKNYLKDFEKINQVKDKLNEIYGKLITMMLFQNYQAKKLLN